MTGFFLTVEGIEGCGKTTQLQKLAQHLRAAGRPCVITREPGGTPLADRIRAILLDPNEDGMDPIAELFLYAASRRQHVVDIVKPALDGGAIVLCDRFTDATLAYQGFGRLLNLDQLRQVNDIATDRLVPDLTLVFDLPEAAGLERARSRNAAQDLEKESRLEGEDLRFHRRVREGYLALAEAEPQRFVVINAAEGIEQVFERTLTAFNARYTGA